MKTKLEVKAQITEELYLKLIKYREALGFDSIADIIRYALRELIVNKQDKVYKIIGELDRSALVRNRSLKGTNAGLEAVN